LFRKNPTMRKPLMKQRKSSEDKQKRGLMRSSSKKEKDDRLEVWRRKDDECNRLSGSARDQCEEERRRMLRELRPLLARLKYMQAKRTGTKASGEFLEET
ncbi:MAG: hypothetical protein M1816_001935, partial [Peltula sp. TS41687]